MIQKNVPVVPASLMVADKPCLIVGGGPVALGKLRHLIAGQAQVTIIAPVVDELMSEMIAEKNIKWIGRAFEASDLDIDYTLVYAATSHSETNAHIVSLCHEKKIFCCAVDKSWRQGDFVTPAVIRNEGTTVSISTGGGNCRRSRIIKEELTRQIDSIENASLLILGTSHQQLALEKREPFHLAGEKIEALGRFLNQLRGIHEFMILNTCNRVELIALADCQPDLMHLIKSYLGYDKLDEDEYYQLQGFDAFAHLNILTAGLLSQTPGENHIVAQVKEAHAIADSFGWSRRVLKQWVDTTIHVSRHIRQVTAPHLRQVELEDLCVEYLDRKECKSHPVMIVGTGVIGEGLKSRFIKQGYSVIWCYHQNKPTIAPEEAEQVEVIQLINLSRSLSKVASVICATGSLDYILGKNMYEDFSQDHETWLVDLSMPRNIDHALEKGKVNVIDLDDLKHWYRRSAADWDTINEKGNIQIKEHRVDYEKIIKSFTNRSA